MKIKYDITKDDYIKFNMYHLESSSNVKKELVIHRFIIPMMLVGLSAAFYVLTGLPLHIGVPLFLGIGIVWAVFYPKYYRKNALKNVSKVVDSGFQSSGVSKNTINVLDEGIHSSSRAGQTINRWDEVKKVHETDEYFFIYVTDKIAHVIPKRAFANKEEEHEFIEIINRNIAK
ncbi:MAG: YcxB family protein [Clostridium sp.]|uniref:YcxB family protein n=1 Tax=Clostridium sp. TaxID=1506 RepID=UPI002FC5CB0F